MAEAVFSAEVDLTKAEAAIKGLQEIIRELRTSQDEYKKSQTWMAKLTERMKAFKKAWDNSFVKKALVVPLKAAWGVLKGMVLTAGALGAALLATTLGSIENNRKAVSGNTTRGKNAAWGWAQEMYGLDSSEFNIGALHTASNDITQYGNFATLGLDKNKIRSMRGEDAMMYSMSKLADYLKSLNGADASPYHVQAAQSLFGVNINDPFIKDLLTKNMGQFKGYYNEGLQRRSGIKYNEMLKGERALKRFQDTMKTFGMTLASNLLPIVTRVMTRLQGYLPKLRPLFETLGEWLFKLLDKGLDQLDKIDIEGFLNKAVQGVKDFATWVQSIDWKSLFDNIANVFNKISEFFNLMNPTSDIKLATGMTNYRDEMIAAKQRGDMATFNRLYAGQLAGMIANGEKLAAHQDAFFRKYLAEMRGKVDVNVKLDGKHAASATADLIPTSVGGRPN